MENAASGRHFHGDCFGDFVFPKKNSSAAFLSPGQEEKDEEEGVCWWPRELFNRS